MELIGLDRRHFLISSSELLLVPGAVLAQAPSAPGSTGNASTLCRDIDNIVAAHVEEYMVLGGALAVAWRGKRVFSRGYGFSDRGRTKAFTIDTPCRIGSISKCLTALAVVKLIEQGKLTLSTRVIPYLNLKPLSELIAIGENVGSITVKHLLHHISGIRNQLSDWRVVAEASGKPGDKLNDEDYIRDLIQFPTDTKPGTAYSYSNIGYNLLGLVVAKSSTVAYEEYVTREILKPLGMANTFMGVADGKSDLERGETCYLELGQPDPYKDRVVLRLGHPSGGWIATIADLDKLLAFLSNYAGPHPPLTRETLRTLATRPPIPNTGSWYYGYGFFIDELPARGGLRFSHGGLHLNAYGYMFGDPEGLTVVILLNTNETSQTVFMKELVPTLQLSAARIAQAILRNAQ